MTNRSAGDRAGESGTLLVADPTSRSVVVLLTQPAAPSAAVTCSERLPRDVVVRLRALTRLVGDMRQEHAADRELSRRLGGVATDLEALIQSIYDDTVWHLAGRRG